MCCDDYAGAVVLTAPPNTRLKLPALVICGKLLFVIIPARRRSLDALR